MIADDEDDTRTQNTRTRRAVNKSRFTHEHHVLDRALCIRAVHVYRRSIDRASPTDFLFRACTTARLHRTRRLKG